MRRNLMLAGAAVVALGAVVGLVLAWGSTANQPAAKPNSPPATAEITRTTLVDTRTVPGTLGYGDVAPIRATGVGTVTWIAPVGSTVQRGEPLFKLDERPVIELYGPVPLYRPLRVGIDQPIQGNDVQQLQENLVELGYAGFKVEGTYTPATAAAVSRWQTDLGLPATGTIELGQVVFTPGSVRIAEQSVRVGDLLGERGVSVINYTGTTRLVTVELEVADRGLATAGREATVTVPGVGRIEGRIARIGTVVTAAQQEGGPGGATSPVADARIEVTVSIADQDALGALDDSPVDVAFVSEERKDVLAVPVAALLAPPGGGYAVEVVEGDTTRIVSVETGMFAAGRVEVSGADLAEGMRVVVPG